MKNLTKVFWLFGRSGAGKTTLGRQLARGLQNRNLPVIYLDGDELRSTLCSDLGFSPEARLENHRRIAEIARLLSQQGLNVVVATMASELMATCCLVSAVPPGLQSSELRFKSVWMVREALARCASKLESARRGVQKGKKCNLLFIFELARKKK